jgi:hypothetical protein
MFKRTHSSQKRQRDYGHKRTSMKEEFIDRQITVLHRAIAEKLVFLHKQGDQKMIINVLATMDERRESGRMRYGEYLTWQSLLEIIDDTDAFIKGMIEDTSQMRKYRRSTPFVGILTEEERTIALEKNAIGYLDLV